MVDSAGPSVSLPVSSHQDVPSPAEQPAVVSMASFQSMISSMAHDALYSHLAQLGLLAIAGSSTQANNPVTMSNSMQFSSSSPMTDWQRPVMSNFVWFCDPSSIICWHKHSVFCGKFHGIMFSTSISNKCTVKCCECFFH